MGGKAAEESAKMIATMLGSGLEEELGVATAMPKLRATDVFTEKATGEAGEEPAKTIATMQGVGLEEELSTSRRRWKKKAKKAKKKAKKAKKKAKKAKKKA